MSRETNIVNGKLNVYNKEKINTFMSLLRSEPALYHWYIFIRLAIATGMRRGELLVGVEGCKLR